MIPQPFLCTEQQPLSVSNSGGSGSQSVTFTSKSQQAQPHMRVANYGAKGCQIAFSATAVATSSAGGTTQVYVGAGEDVIFTRPNQNAVISAICDGTDTTTISIHIGLGS